MGLPKCVKIWIQRQGLGMNGARKLDSRLGAVIANRRREPGQLVLSAAMALLGVHEDGGNNRGQLVELIQSTVGKAEGEPWCMALVQSVIAYAEEESGIRSKMPVTEHCLTAWQAAPVEMRVKEPAPGDIVLWQTGDTSKGHCGVIVSVTEDFLMTIEGNTGSGSALEREGDGVYLKRRIRNMQSAMHELGYLRPF